MISSMGFKTALTEGAKHILGWKSPNYVYCSAASPKLKLLLTNDKLTEDISIRFARTDWDRYPLTADKYMDWIAALPKKNRLSTCISLWTLSARSCRSRPAYSISYMLCPGSPKNAE